MNKTKCDCNMSHDMTFCTNETCNLLRKCMRFNGNHVLNGQWDSFADYCGVYVERFHSCIGFIGEE